jgi:hypothetical protein
MNQLEKSNSGNAVSGDTAYNNSSGLVGRVPLQDCIGDHELMPSLSVPAENAADHIRAVAQLRKWRQRH